MGSKFKVGDKVKYTGPTHRGSVWAKQLILVQGCYRASIKGLCWDGVSRYLFKDNVELVGEKAELQYGDECMVRRPNGHVTHHGIYINKTTGGHHFAVIGDGSKRDFLEGRSFSVACVESAESVEKKEVYFSVGLETQYETELTLAQIDQIYKILGKNKQG